MVAQQVTLKNKLGLHARPAAHFVRLAAQFESDVFLIKDDVRINAKSIMGVLMLAAPEGAKIKVVAEGDDAEVAVSEISELISSKFGED